MKVITDTGKRWELGLPHHPESEKIAEHIQKYDSGMQFEFGGDGDNGEELLFFLDSYFELKELK